jgi:hypothetical protein
MARFPPPAHDNSYLSEYRGGGGRRNPYVRARSQTKISYGALYILYKNNIKKKLFLAPRGYGPAATSEGTRPKTDSVR